MSYQKMLDLDLLNKRILLREDYNVPLEDGEIASDAKLRASLPTLTQALEKGAGVLVLSHLGRPKEGQFSPEFSLAPIAQRLSDLLGTPVHFNKDWLSSAGVSPGSVHLGENVRFLAGEESNDPALAKRMASLCDVFVMDAFASSHRAHASTEGVAKFAKVACAGPLLAKEIQALDNVMKNPKRPLLAIVGGSKISTKLKVLESLIGIADKLILGGGIANTFLAAKGIFVGSSLYEKDLIPMAQDLMKKAESRKTEIILPIDVIVGDRMDSKAKIRSIHLDPIANEKLKPEEKILDIGPKSEERNHSAILSAKTLLWNGPLGLFEAEIFSHGTRALGESIAKSTAYSVAGGGETIAAIEKFGIANSISYISTGGGAFLEYIEGRSLPGIVALEKRQE